MLSTGGLTKLTKLTMSHSSSIIVDKAAIICAAKAVAHALSDQVAYAIVGGSACLLLGGQRLTRDIDFVVPQGSTATARKLFKAAGTFNIEPRTNHTKHAATNVDIEILAPPKMFQGEFDENTPTVTVDGVRVLHPLLLLNAKCGSMPQRSSDGKRMTDANDIAFLLRYCVEEKIEIVSSSVPNARAEVVAYTIEQEWVAREDWEAAGYVEGSKSRGLPLTHELGLTLLPPCRRLGARTASATRVARLRGPKGLPETSGNQMPRISSYQPDFSAYLNHVPSSDFGRYPEYDAYIDE